MPLSDFEHPDAWARDLDARWPERSAMKQTLLALAGAEIAARGAGTTRVLELGFGTGELLVALVDRFPQVRLEGIDAQPALQALVAERLPGVRRIRADLCDPGWTEAAGTGYDVIYSLQTFHDLGGRAALRSTYRAAAGCLKPGGVLLNADFVVPFPGDDPRRPRRFATGTHVAELRACGLEMVSVARSDGAMACLTARRPERPDQAMEAACSRV